MNSKKINHIKKIWLPPLFIILIVLIFWESVSLQESFYSFLPIIEKHIHIYPISYGIGFVVLAIISAMFSPFSSIPLAPFAILSWGKATTLVLLLGGWIIGATLTFYIGRYLGRPTLERYFSFKKIDYYEKQIPKKAELWFLLLFRFSLPIEIPGYTLGLTKVSFIKYIIATFLAELPIAIFTLYGSNAFLEKNFPITIAWISAGLLLLTTTFLIFYKVLKKRRHLLNKSQKTSKL